MREREYEEAQASSYCPGRVAEAIGVATHPALRLISFS